MSELVMLALILLCGPLVLAISSGVLALAAQAIFGSNPTLRQQRMIDMFMAMYGIASQAVVGPFRFLRQADAPRMPGAPPTVPTDGPALPHDVSKQIEK